jgi:hypothetical protein
MPCREMAGWSFYRDYAACWAMMRMANAERGNEMAVKRQGAASTNYRRGLKTQMPKGG